MIELSTAEAEYVAMSQTIHVARIVHKLETEINVDPAGIMNVWSDNEELIHVTKARAGTKRRNFIEISNHLIQETIMKYKVKIGHVPAIKQKSNIFTKPFRRMEFN